MCLLSVLIPVYNYDMRPLVQGLCQELAELQAGVAELRLLDDGSKPEYKQLNSSLGENPLLIYSELEENKGRAICRNRLAAEARGQYLLFLDCDSGLLSAQYLRNYCASLRSDALLYGGRSYSAEPPENSRYLHWLFGSEREAMLAAKRREKPYHAFTTCNFVIPRAIYEQFPLNEALRQYGHEDTLLAQQLQAAGIPIIHIDNPLEHLDLQEAPVFLEKTRLALQNLLFLDTSYALEEQVRVLRVYKKLGLFSWLFVLLFRIFRPLLEKQLCSSRPRLFFLDLYKLGYLAFLFSQEQQHRR